MSPVSKQELSELSYHERSTRVIDALQMTFAHLHSSNQSVHNLDIVTDLLGLDIGEQQDLHELSNLLIAKIDSQQTSELGKRLTNLSSVSQLMNGVQKFSVTCQKCHHVSSRKETFCELDLAVEGHKSICDSLAHYFQEEVLDGDNKYECSNCNARQDAIRRTEIVAAPPVLFVHLRRNIYDMKTFQKIKLKSSIQLPSKLSILNSSYKLTAVVYHRGASAYGGHYIAEVLNWEDKKWWLCDDSIVLHSPGPCLPDNEVSDLTQNIASEDNSVDLKLDNKLKRHGRAASDSLQSLYESDPIAPSASPGSQKETPDGNVDERGVSSSYDDDSLLNGDDIKEYERAHKLNRSKDVYMLLYVREELLPTPSSNKPCHQMTSSGNDLLLETPKCLWKQNQMDMVFEKNRVFSDAFEKYMSKAADIKRQIEERKEEYKSFELLCDGEEMKKLGVDVDLTKSYFVPTQWLQSWIIGQPVTSTLPKQLICSKDICDLTEDPFCQTSALEGTIETEESTELIDDDTRSNYLFAESIRNLPFVCSHSQSYEHSTDEEFASSLANQDKNSTNSLHPSTIADHFKLIPIAAYDVLLESLRKRTRSTTSLVDCEFTNFTVKCDMCTSIEMSKKDSLKDTYDKYFKLMNLLNSNSDDKSYLCHGDDSTVGRLCVEKRWVTWLKKTVEKLAKELSGKKQQSRKNKNISDLLLSQGTNKKLSSQSNAVQEVVVLDNDAQDDVNVSKTSAGAPGGLGCEHIIQPEEDDKEEEDDVLNQVLVCAHGLLVPGFYRRARYISPGMWQSIVDAFPSSIPLFVAANDISSSSLKGSKLIGRRSKFLLPKAMSECDACALKSVQDKELLQDDQMIRRTERTGDNKCLNDLARRVTCFSASPLDTSLNYFVIEGWWLDLWRTYTLDTHGIVERPPMLINESLKCKHGGINLPKMLHDKLHSSVKNENSVDIASYNVSKNTEVYLSEEAPICELVTEPQWYALGNLGYYEGGNGKQSVNEIYCAAIPDTVAFSCTTPTTSVVDGINNVKWKWFPEQCVSCASSISEQRKLARTYFQNKNIQVIELQSLDELDSLKNSAEKNIDSPLLCSRRSSRSSRGSKYGKKNVLEVSSDDILAMLTLKIYELWPHARPTDQKVYNSLGDRLEGYHNTLESLGVLASCTLYVIVGSNDETASSVPRKNRGASQSRKRRKSKLIDENDDGSCGVEGDIGDGYDVDDGGESEMWQIISIYSNGGYNHVNHASSSGGNETGDQEVTDLTSSCEKSSDNNKKRKATAEDGFSGTFLMSG
jgi:hypothetical protein